MRLFACPRGIPAKRRRSKPHLPKRLFVTHTVAAALVSLLWVEVAKLIAYLLSQVHAFQGLDQKFAPQAPLLFAAGFMLFFLALGSYHLILEIEQTRSPPTCAPENSGFARYAETKALE